MKMNLHNLLQKITNELAKCNREYCEYSRILVKILKESSENNLELATLASLLNNICSLRVNNEVKEQPFRATNYDNIAMKNYDTLTCKDVELLDDILDTTSDYLLKARIADILWILKDKYKDIFIKRKKQPHKYAEIAITEYQKFNIDNTNIADNDQYIIRAIYLCKELGKTGKQYLEQLHLKIINVFTLTPVSEEIPMYHVFLSKILKNTGLDTHNSDIICKLESIGDDLISEKKYYQANLYFENAINFTKFDDDKANMLLSKIANSLIKESKDKALIHNYYYAGVLISRAIDTYKNIADRKKRLKYIKDKDFYSLFSNRELHFEKALSTCDSLSLVQRIENSSCKIFKQLILDLSKEDAVRKLASFLDLSSPEDLNKYIVKTKENGNIRHILSSEHLLFKGNVIKIVPPFDIDDPESENTKKWELHNKIKYNILSMQYKSMSYILPALEELNLKYIISFDDIFAFCQRSEIVPFDKKVMWAKGLWNGFHMDFITSIHFLIPLLEDFVRGLFKLNNIRTTVTDSVTKLENEKALTHLLGSTKEAISLLSEPIYLDMYSLLGGEGQNLRSLLAHGLLSDNDLYKLTPILVYLWWLCLHIVFNCNITCNENKVV